MRKSRRQAPILRKKRLYSHEKIYRNFLHTKYAVRIYTDNVCKFYYLELLQQSMGKIVNILLSYIMTN